MKKMIVPIFIIATLLASCHGLRYTYPLRTRVSDGVSKRYPTDVYCSSWRLAVETNNLRGFKTIPEVCEEYVGNYLLSEQYQSDSKTVCVQSYYHALSLDIDSKRDIWIFGVDDTTLSSVPFYKDNGFGVRPFNGTAWHAWVREGVAPALPETRKLYEKILSLNIKPVFITTRRHDVRDVTERNLKKAGFHSWEKLITRDNKFNDVSKQEYREAMRQQLVDEGYRIVGSIGDQWSDLMGENEGLRTFKLPNPIYYVE